MVFAVKPFFDVLDVTPTPVSNRATVQVSGDGLTVYATTAVSGGSLCSLSDGAGNAVALQGVANTGTFEVTASDGTRMYPIATTPQDLAAGSYTLRCVGIGGLPLALGDRVDFEGVLLQVGGLFILAGFLGMAGLVVLIVVLVRPHSSKTRVRMAQAAYAGWGQWYASPYAGYPGYPDYPQQTPQPGYPQYGSPQQTPQPGYPQYGSPQPTWPPADDAETGRPDAQGRPDDDR